jgi:hypothetical protein
MKISEYTHCYLCSNGVPVKKSKYIPAVRLEPNRFLPLKPWHKFGSYRKRIQKKWNKRFGVNQVVVAIRR